MSVLSHNPVADLIAAFILLTRIPLPWVRVSDKAPDLNASVWAFPIVGVVVGLGGAGVYTISLQLGLSPLVSAFLAIGGMILLTGALHEDGLADVADGFGGGGTVERKLEIMRDSRIGAYGMIAIVLAIGLRVGSLADLSASQAASALVIAGMASRLMMAFVMRYLSPARTDGLAHDTGKPTQMSLSIGTALTISIIIWLVDPVASLWVMCVAFASCLMMAGIAKRQILGMTGDVLGAVQQVTDIAILLFLVSWWR